MGEVNEYVKKFATKNKGRALDIACGLGQNSLYLAELGMRVDALDISDIAIKRLPSHPMIHPICMDIEDFEIESSAYEVIVCIDFLKRSLFEDMKNGLKKDGILIFRTFLKEAKINPMFTIAQNELLEAFWDLKIVYYEYIPKSEQVVLVAKKVK